MSIKQKAIKDMDDAVANISLAIGFDLSGEDFDELKDAWDQIKKLYKMEKT